MEKQELVANVAKRAKITPEQAGAAVDHVLIELLSPRIFGGGPGGAGIFDNSCPNNCKEEMAKALGGQITNPGR